VEKYKKAYLRRDLISGSKAACPARYFSTTSWLFWQKRWILGQ